MASSRHGRDTAAHRRWLARIDSVTADGPYRPDWSSLADVEAPAWYVNGKFGIFVHWGPYAVPAYGTEWYPREMYRPGTPTHRHHVATYGPVTEFGYKDFIPQFRAERFDAEGWAGLFKRSGAQYVVPVAEHHDGFAMYDTRLSRWNAKAMGPQRDVLGELARAVTEQSMVFGASSHRAEHWWFYRAGAEHPSDVLDPQWADLYGPAARPEVDPTEPFLEDWLVRTAELIDRYRPQLLYFDWWIDRPAFEPYLRRVAAYYYNRAARWRRPVAINYKYGAFPEGAAIFTVERGTLEGIRERFWQTDTAVGRRSCGYVEDQPYRSAHEILTDLADVVSKNGALLLNIGPKADGTIPEADTSILEAVGAWLSRNGEAIYGTRPWHVPGEGQHWASVGAFGEQTVTPYTAGDVRFTRNGDDVFAIVMAEAVEGEIELASLGERAGLLEREIAEVRLLGEPEPVPFTRRQDGLRLPLPRGSALHMPVFRIRPVPEPGRPWVVPLPQDV